MHHAWHKQATMQKISTWQWLNYMKLSACKLPAVANVQPWPESPPSAGEVWPYFCQCMLVCILYRSNISADRNGCLSTAIGGGIGKNIRADRHGALAVPQRKLCPHCVPHCAQRAQASRLLGGVWPDKRELQACVMTISPDRVVPTPI